MPNPAGFTTTFGHRNSFHTNDENLPPNSPPPAYSTVIEPALPDKNWGSKEKSTPYPMDESWEYRYTCNNASISELQANVPSSFEPITFGKPELKEQHIFASSGTQIQELQGSDTSFLATNYSGPVDPFELMGSAPSPKTSSGFSNTASQYEDPAQRLGQIMENLSIPAELPGDDSLYTQHITSIPQNRAEPPYHGSWRRRPVPNAIPELPTNCEPAHQIPQLRSEGAHSDQEVASYVSRRIQSQRNFRNLLDHLDHLEY